MKQRPFFPLVCAAAMLCAACASAPPRKAIAQDWYEVGNAWYDLGKWDKAGAAYAKAIALDPGFLGASFNMARALCESGDYKGALQAVERVLLNDPKNTRALSLKAYIYYRRGDSASALKTYEAVMELEPYAPDAVYNTALLREAKGEDAEAVKALEQLLSVKTDDAQALSLYARLLAKLDRKEEAAQTYEKLQGLGKASAADLMALGRLYEESSSFAKAIEAYAAAAAADPKLPDAWFELAKLKLTEAEDGKGGLEALAKALAAGFSDREKASALLSSTSLVERESVLKALKEKGLAE